MTIKHIVLSGGGPSGIQTLGTIQHLEECGVWNIENIKSIYATSSGAIISLLIALKFDWDTINDYIILRPWHETYKINVQHILDSYTKKGLLDYDSIETFYKPFFNAKDIPLNITMKEFYEYSNIELHFFSLEINSFDVVDINYMSYPDIPVIKSVLMSCAIPIIFCPVCIEDKCFVDGGFKTNYPLENCIEINKEKDEILGIKNDFIDEEKPEIRNESTMLEFVIHISNKFMNSILIKINPNISIENEVICKTKHVSLTFIKEVIFSSDIRKSLLEDGIQICQIK